MTLKLNKVKFCKEKFEVFVIFYVNSKKLKHDFLRTRVNDNDKVTNVAFSQKSLL